MDYIFSNLWLILAVYILLRSLHYITSDYFFSVFLQQYSFTMYLGFMMLEGNSQFFTYLIFNEFQMTPNEHVMHKVSHVYSLLTNFVILSFSCLCFIIIYYSFEE